MLNTYLNLLDLCYFEVTEAFKGLADENVWKRPTVQLLSVGELAGHIAYGEAVRFAGANESGGASRDFSDCRIASPLLDPRFSYYPTTVDSSTSAAQLAMTAEQVLHELQRIHSESMVFLKALNPDMSSPAPHWDFSYQELMKYLVFHIAYHTGQMYSVRHLLGEETPDN